MTLTELFFGSWEGILHVVVIGGLAYLGFIALLLLFGKGMLMEASPSSLVVTASLGSGLAAIVLVQSIGIFEGLVGFFIIMLVQTGLVHLSNGSEQARGFLQEKPTLLYFEGQLLEPVMRQFGVAKADVFAAMRGAGMHSPDEVGAVILESNGTLSVVSRSESGKYSALEGTEHFPFNSAKWHLDEPKRKSDS